MPYVDYTAAFVARMEQDRTRRLQHMHACQLVLLRWPDSRVNVSQSFCTALISSYSPRTLIHRPLVIFQAVHSARNRG